jgi:hypothetical protein
MVRDIDRGRPILSDNALLEQIARDAAARGRDHVAADGDVIVPALI